MEWVGWREWWRGWEDGVGRMEGVVEGVGGWNR